MADIEFDGKQVRMVPLWELELGDLAFIREHYDIAGQIELEDGLAGMEPVAWRALMVASIRRSVPDVDPKTPLIDSVPMVPLIEAMNEDAEKHTAEQAKAKAGRSRPTGGSKRTRATSGSQSSA